MIPWSNFKIPGIVLLCLFSLVMTLGCQISPLYKSQSRSILTSIKVNPPKVSDDRYFFRAIKARQGRNEAIRYQLEWRLVLRTKDPEVVILDDNTSQWIIQEGNFNLKDQAGGSIHRFKIRVSTVAPKSTNPFGTQQARKKALSVLGELMAHRAEQHLLAYFLDAHGQSS